MKEEETRTLAFSDPISTVLELNEKMLARTSRMRLIFTYAYYASIIISIVSFVTLMLLAFYEPFSAAYPLMFAILVVSLPVAFLSLKELRFIDDYELLAAAVSRASHWVPNPAIPDGASPVDRFIKYLSSTDRRLGYYYNKKPGCWISNAPFKGKNAREIAFDGYFDCSTFPWDKVRESVTIFLRVKPVVVSDDARRMKEDVEEVLSGFSRKWRSKPRAVRALIIQTENADFSEEVIRSGNENLVEYDKDMPSGKREWNCPVELVAEDPKGMYNFGIIYFG